MRANRMSKKTRKQRRGFTEEYKAEVVRLCREAGKTPHAVARQLGLTPSSVSAWLRQSEVDQGTGWRTFSHACGAGAGRLAGCASGGRFQQPVQSWVMGVLSSRPFFVVGSAALAAAIIGTAWGAATEVPDVRSGVKGNLEAVGESTRRGARAALAVAIGAAAGLLPGRHPALIGLKAIVAGTLAFYTGRSAPFVRAKKTMDTKPEKVEAGVKRTLDAMGTRSVCWARNGSRVRARLRGGGGHASTLLDIRIGEQNVVVEGQNVRPLDRFDHPAIPRTVSEFVTRLESTIKRAP